MYTGFNTFLFEVFFGVFYAKIIVFMVRLLIVSIKFLFHSINIFGIIFIVVLIDR